MLLAIACGAGFVARGFTGHKEQLISLMKQAITYKGYALVDILHKFLEIGHGLQGLFVPVQSDH